MSWMRSDSNSCSPKIYIGHNYLPSELWEGWPVNCLFLYGSTGRSQGLYIVTVGSMTIMFNVVGPENHKILLEETKAHEQQITLPCYDLTIWSRESSY